MHPENHDGRFAPSPTGRLHVGNLRTALAAWLFARSQGARFLVRIDDLDPDRSRPEHAAGQLADLAAIGIDWDGEPVLQSQRRALHAAALEQLRALELTYPCFCTRAEVRAAASAPNAPVGVDGGYPGTCARLGSDEAARRVVAGEPWCERLRATAAVVSWVDRVLGEQLGVVDDVVVCRRDGVPAYNLACVVDDHDQGIGEVVRGDDLGTSTPAQAFILDALGLPRPTWAHVPIVVGPDGTRLAKRHGAVTLADLAERGVGNVEVLRWMAASLGVELPAGNVSATDLVREFDAEQVPRETTVFAEPSRPR